LPTTIDHYALAILDNFETEIEEVRLRDHPRIVRLNLLTDPRSDLLLGERASRAGKEDRAQTFLSERGYPVRPFREITGMTFQKRIDEFAHHAIEWHFAGKVGDPFNEHYDRFFPIKLFSDVVTSLRLLKSGQIGRLASTHLIMGDPSGIEGPWSVTETLNYAPSVADSFKPYRFLRDDVESLKRLFAELSTCKNQQIRIAIDRFDRQYSRESDADRLIDIMIGFESLYLKGAKDSELRFRLAARAARHLGHERSQRQNIFDCVTAAYELRSQTVHGAINTLNGSKLLGNWKTPNAMLNQLSSILGSAIQSILLEVGPMSFAKDFHGKLDNAIIQGADR